MEGRDVCSVRSARHGVFAMLAREGWFMSKSTRAAAG